MLAMWGGEATKTYGRLSIEARKEILTFPLPVQSPPQSAKDLQMTGIDPYGQCDQPKVLNTLKTELLACNKIHFKAQCNFVT